MILALRRFGPVGLLVLGLCAAAAAPARADTATIAPATAPAASPNTALNIMQATAAMQAGKCDEALPILEQLWNDPELLKSDPDLAEKFRFQRIICTIALKGMPAALALSEESLKHPGATVASYDLRIFLLLSSRQTDAAATVLAEAVTRFSATAYKLTDMTVMGTLLTVKLERRRELLAGLQRAGWQIRDPSGRLVIDFLRLDGLRTAVKADDKVLADLFRADIADNALIYPISQGDGAISDANVPPAYVMPVLRQQIQDVQTYIANTPTDLPGLRYLILLQRTADEQQLALVQLNGVLQLIRVNGLEKFKAPNTYPNLIRDKALLLTELGKTEEALTLYKEGAKVMKGAGTFTFTMSYMDFLIGLGRDQEALALESNIDFTQLDEGQKRRLAAVQGCAYGYLKDTMRYDVSLSMATTPSGLTDPKIYLCAGDTEGAAKALIAHINTPSSRDETIITLQNGKPPIAYSERSKALNAAVAALKKRPDVMAAAKAQNIIIRDWPIRF
ncbi:MULTISPECIES: hypothetical protein [Asticcacaulis]|uniref:hypothetical protein n=1 Tax=Asticcacaulis TaxID=76890 RepID=UPI001AEB72A5|nr:MULTISPECIES: hypothetical protein [Asticcacaulis]MBP2159463.1 tetratricopeptide (TPR) repeat protein [Asticcacaulis solisilvae]MDR6800710.1 tetratricopeptide (TPR) repeat protein [Asticcacaulis sp. BE141]